MKLFSGWGWYKYNFKWGRGAAPEENNPEQTENIEPSRGNVGNRIENLRKNTTKQGKNRSKKRKREKKVLKCITTNAQSLKNKMDEFMKVVETNKQQINNKQATNMSNKQ